MIKRFIIYCEKGLLMRKKVSLKEISQKCGVSSALVSSVLSGRKSANRCSRETSEKIIACAKELGYTPNILAQAIATGKSPIILFSLSENETWEKGADFYLNDLILAGSKRFAEEGLYVLYMSYRTVEEQFEQIQKSVRSGMVSGVVTNLLNPKGSKLLYDYMLECQYPAVFLGFPDSDKVVSVGVDNQPVDVFLSEYAKKKGFRRGIQVSEGPEDRKFIVHPERVPFELSLLDDPGNLFFAAGFLNYTKILKKMPGIDKTRLVLLEDTRFYTGGLRSILIPSAQPSVIEQTCRILSAWCREGEAPAVRTHIIKRSMKEVEIYE